MKPPGILLFLLSVFLLLFAGALYFPEGGIRIAENLRLQFVSKNDLFSSDSAQYADIKIILKQQQYLTDSVLTAIAGGQARDLKIPGTSTDSLVNSISRIECDSTGERIIERSHIRVRCINANVLQIHP